MTDNTYNGWTNWETWMVNLWMTNDVGTYEAAREQPTASRLRDWWDELATDELEGFVADCVNGVLSEVDWQEIYDGLHEGDEE